MDEAARQYYARGREQGRLVDGHDLLEFWRTTELLERLAPELPTDPAARERLLALVRATEREPSLLGLGGHLLAQGRTPATRDLTPSQWMASKPPQCLPSATMDTDPPVLSRRGETITLDADCVDDVHRHSAFSLWDDADEMPDGVDPTTQRVASGAPVPVRRSDLDDVARAETEALISLAGALDDVCLDVLGGLVEVETVAPADLADWLVAATESVNDVAAPTCSVNAYLDARLRRYARLANRPAAGRRTVVDAGWCEADVRLMSRDPETLQAVIADEHLVGLRGYLAVSLTSVDFGAEEFLTASAVFGYSPRIALHPGEIRIARLTPPTP